MKKAVILAGCALLIAPAAFAQVYSANAVGYVKKSIDPGAFDLLRYDFLAIEPGETLIGDVVPQDQVPIGTKAFFWNSAAQTFDSEGVVYIKADDKVEWNPGTSVVEPGVGFFLQIPDTEPAAVDVVMVGEVPGSNNDSDNTDLPIVEGFSLVGYPYPATRAWEDTTLAQSAELGDKLFTWDAAAQSYASAGFIYVKAEDVNRWNPQGIMLEPGQGFFYQKESAGGKTWAEAKPYQWP